MNKKGDISIKYIIAIIIALMVLIVVVLVFKQQIGTFIEKLGGLVTNIFTPVESVDLAN